MLNPFVYRYKSEIHIKRSREDVWDALTDLESYHIWNPFTPKVMTSWKIGDAVHLTVQMKKGKPPIQQKEYLSRFHPKDEFAWGMKWGIFLKAERVQRLIDHNDNQTRYFTEDVIEGPLSPIVHMIYGKSIKQGFDLLAQGLKKHLEA